MPRESLIVAPSLLAGKHSNLIQSLQEVNNSLAQWIHLDIMDGHFVPNLSFGPQTIKELRPQSKLFFDTHLMLSNPHEYIDAFLDAGSDNITIHVEPTYDIHGTLKKIRDRGCQCGIALNPKTSPESLLPYLDQVDLVLAMTVQPGHGGQAFIEEVLKKIKCIHDWREEKKYPFRLEVDGGINIQTAKEAFDAGADTFVAGSAFFKANDKNKFIQTIEGY